MPSLDNLAIKYGTDKSSEFHGYTRVYDEFFSAMQYNNLSILEIGVAGGRSIRMWLEYFTNAKIYGVDMDYPEEVKAVLGKESRFEMLQCKQHDTPKLCRLVAGKTFDYVIDDGSHMEKQILASFEVLWPLVKKGYFIEDVHLSLRKPKVKGKILAKTFDWVKSLNYKGDRLFLGQPSLKEVPGHQNTIESITYYPGLVYIRKKV